MVETVPNVLDNVHVGTGGWPQKHIKVIFVKPVFDNVGCVLGTVILLEIAVMEVQVEVIKGSQEVIL
jgi:hypothetical protein